MAKILTGNFGGQSAPVTPTEPEEPGVNLSAFLPDLQPGDTVIGVVTEAEVQTLLQYLHSQKMMLEMTHACYIRGVTAASRYFQENLAKPNLKPINEVISEASGFLTDAEAKLFCKISNQADTLSALLLFTVKERLDVHHLVLAFRTKGRIVCVGKRAALPGK